MSDGVSLDDFVFGEQFAFENGKNPVVDGVDASGLIRR